MRSGPYSAGQDAEQFLLRRLGQGPVAVAKLREEASRAGLSWATVDRASKRLLVAKPVCWAWPESAPQQATVEREEQVEAEGPAVAAAAETDPRVERAVAEVTNLVVGGIGTLDFAIHQACQGDPELRAQVETVLSKR